MNWLNAHPSVKKALSGALVAGAAAIAQQLMTHLPELPTYVQPFGAAAFSWFVHALAPWGTVQLPVTKPATQDQSP